MSAMLPVMRNLLVHEQETPRINWQDSITEGLVLAPVNDRDIAKGRTLATGYGGGPYVRYVKYPEWRPPSPYDYALCSGSASTIVSSPVNGFNDLPDLMPAVFTAMVAVAHFSGVTYASGTHTGWTASGALGFAIGRRYASANLYATVGAVAVEQGVSLKDDRYHLCGVSFDGTNIRLWKDGVNVASATGAAPTYAFAAGYDHFYCGYWPNFLLFNRVLSAAEHLRLFRDPKCIFAVQQRPRLISLPIGPFVYARPTADVSLGNWVGV